MKPPAKPSKPVSRNLPAPPTPAQQDVTNNVLIYEGATVQDLKYIFAMQRDEVVRRLGSLPPMGRRRGVETYRLKDAAQRLVIADMTDQEEIMTQLMKMRVEDLPEKLRKNYWDTERSKLMTQEKLKELWPTTSIVSIVGGALKTIRMSLLLIPDTLNREAGLTDAQHSTITRLIDSALEKLFKDLTDGFNNRRDDPLDEPEAPEEDDQAADL